MTSAKRKFLGNILKNGREAAGFTQAEIAKKFGYSTPQFVSNWERDLAAPPMTALKKLIKLYGLDEHEVFEAMLSAEIENATMQLKSSFSRSRA